MWTFKKKIAWVFYKITAFWLPISRRSRCGKRLRGFWAKRIAKSFGKNVNIEKGAIFTPGLSIGDNSVWVLTVKLTEWLLLETTL